MALNDKVLLFGVDRSDIRGTNIYRLMESMGIEVISAGIFDFDKKVIDLLEKRGGHEEVGVKKIEGRAWQGEFMLMCGFSDEKLNALIRAMRDTGLSISYKARANENNINWKLIDLMEEIKEEHEKMQEYMRMQMELQKAQKGE